MAVRLTVELLVSVAVLLWWTHVARFSCHFVCVDLRTRQCIGAADHCHTSMSVVSTAQQNLLYLNCSFYVHIKTLKTSVLTLEKFLFSFPICIRLICSAHDFCLKKFLMSFT